MTRIIQFNQHGPPAVLQPVARDLPTPGEGEVQVRQTAIGVNYLDIYVRRGDFGGPTPGETGFEAAGVIEAVGPGVDHLTVGDRVAYHLVKGAYATDRVIKTDRLVRLPEGVSDQAAASVMLKGMTAAVLLKHFRKVGPGDTVLIHAASGGVGSILTQWASHLGARVIATVGTAQKAQAALENGAEAAIIYTQEDFVSRVKDLTDGRGVDLTLDGVGKTTFHRNFEVLATFGTNALFGWSSGNPDPIDPKALNSRSHEVAAPSVGHYTATRAQLDAVAADLFDAMASGAISVEPGHRYALTDAAVAHTDLEARQTQGAVILVP